MGGYSWCPIGKQVKVGINALQTKILCCKHNNELNILDTTAKKLFEYFAKIEDCRRHNAEILEIPSAINLRGNLFERWLLKFVVGVMYSKNASAGKMEINEGFVDADIVKILFGLKQWPKTQGLYLDNTKRISLSKKQFNADLCINADNKKLVLVECDFHGLPFALSLCDSNTPKEELPSGDLYNSYVFHPSRVIINRVSKRYEVNITWPDNYENNGDVYYFVP